MIKIIAMVGIVLSLISTAVADVPPPVTINSHTADGNGNKIGSGIINGATGLNVHLIDGTLLSNFSTNTLQTAGNASLSSIDLKLPVLGQSNKAGSVSVTLASDQGSLGVTVSNTAFGISGNLPAFTTVPTFNLGTLNGAATSAKQDTIITNLGSPFQAGGNIGNTSFVATQGTAANLNATVVTTGGATIAQDSSISTANGYLSTLASNSVYNPINANADLAARQTVTASETYLAAPSNAVGVIVECESVNDDALRWGFSNSSANILSSTLGMLCESGRDTGELYFGQGTYVHFISTGAGTDYADVQFILTH